MTPDMSARDITFARKTTTIDGFLTRYWYWGQRERLNSIDPQEQQYQMCYPGQPPIMCPDGTTADDRGIADEMIERRKEKMTIDALHDLVAYLRGVREERKAVLAITDGWRLFQPHEQLARKVTCDIPTAAGRRRSADRQTDRTHADQWVQRSEARLVRARSHDPGVHGRRLVVPPAARRSQRRQHLVLSDRSARPGRLRRIDREAGDGRAAAGSTTITPPSVDAARLRARIDSLRTLGEATDGLAIVDSNDLARGFKRVVDDLSSYYLIGYYSNGKLDGKFHSISVR